MAPLRADAALDDSSKQCRNFGPGHSPHWIQVFESVRPSEVAPVEAELVEVKRDGTVIVDVGGTRREFWNHEPARLPRLAGRNDGRVTVQERWRLLRTAGGAVGETYCFSILISEKDTKRKCQPYRQAKGLVNENASSDGADQRDARRGKPSTSPTSRARAALDTWLADAAELVAEQRTRSISPSSHFGSWVADERHSIQTVREVTAGLESLLGQLTAAPGRWILIIEDARTPCHYWQVIAYEDGSLLAEVTSNYFLDQLTDTSHRWDAAQEEKLAALGWESPAPTWKPNWTDLWPTYTPPVGVVASRALRTLREVFGLSGDDAVVVKMFSSPNRGGTPASELVPDDVENEDREHPTQANRVSEAIVSSDIPTEIAPVHNPHVVFDFDLVNMSRKELHELALSLSGPHGPMFNSPVANEGLVAIERELERDDATRGSRW